MPFDLKIYIAGTIVALSFLLVTIIMQAKGLI